MSRLMGVVLVGILAGSGCSFALSSPTMPPKKNRQPLDCPSVAAPVLDLTAGVALLAIAGAAVKDPGWYYVGLLYVAAPAGLTGVIFALASQSGFRTVAECGDINDRIALEEKREAQRKERKQRQCERDRRKGLAQLASDAVAALDLPLCTVEHELLWDLSRDAFRAAMAGDCAAVPALTDRIREVDVEYYESVIKRQTDIVACEAPPEPMAPPPEAEPEHTDPAPDP